MTSTQHEHNFLEFVLTQDVFKYLTFGDKQIVGQKLIGVLVEKENTGNQPYYTEFVKDLWEQNAFVVDPDWLKIYYDFIEVGPTESADYIKSVLENKGLNVIFNFIVRVILLRVVERNINANELYFIIDENWPTDWLTEVIEV